MSALDLKVAAARTAGRLARLAGRGGGTSLPGVLLTRMAPDAISRLAARLPQGSVAISATNGKTTSAAMTAAILERSGLRLVHNRAGANMASGIASTLAAAAGRGGRIDGQLGLFEVDEFWLDQVVPALRPRSLLLGNLFRDQLDRYGELETIADRWAAMVAAMDAGAQLALNADDPLIADLGRERRGVVYFGVEDRSLTLPEMQHAADSKHCRRCGTAYEYDAIYLGHLGVYRCPGCGAARPQPVVSATDVRLFRTDAAAFELHTPGGTVEVALPLPGLYNVYNALGAAALCTSLGIAPQAIAEGLAAVSAAFGRAERVVIGERTLSLLLIKNPAGANEVLRTLILEEDELDLLGVLNDRTADGHDISWIWDADFELLAGRAGRVTCAGTRAAELALRFKYAGVAPDRLHVVPALPAALDDALTGARSGRVFALPTYTALLELRAELARRGHVESFWAREAA
ncbi:MAG TPA: Mur ligase family protein [Solirubrobacteraceae bacterium]|nr:Mur ligase family protein [Solirubrobacteraceae bacterium]